MIHGRLGSRFLPRTDDVGTHSSHTTLEYARVDPTAPRSHRQKFTHRSALSLTPDSSDTVRGNTTSPTGYQKISCHSKQYFGCGLFDVCSPKWILFTLYLGGQRVFNIVQNPVLPSCLEKLYLYLTSWYCALTLYSYWSFCLLIHLEAAEAPICKDNFCEKSHLYNDLNFRVMWVSKKSYLVRRHFRVLRMDTTPTSPLCQQVLGTQTRRIETSFYQLIWV